jgi:hypothetical protein
MQVSLHNFDTGGLKKVIKYSCKKCIFSNKIRFETLDNFSLSTRKGMLFLYLI